MDVTTIPAIENAPSPTHGDAATPAVFRFTELSRELRDLVYGFYFEDTEPEGTAITLADLQTKRPSPDLVLASRQICAESLELWRVANERFWQSHKFCAELSILPVPEIISGDCVIPRSGLKTTIVGDVDIETFQIRNVTPLGNAIRRLKRLYIGLTSHPVISIVMWENVDRYRTRDIEAWPHAEKYHRIYVTDLGDYQWARRTHVIVVVSRMDMLEALTAYLKWQKRDGAIIYCDDASRRPEADWSEDGDIFMIEGSRG